MPYASRYERLLANSVPADPENPQSCWLWTGSLRRGYPAMTVRKAPRPAAPSRVNAARAMLEEVLEVEFPHDEGGHLCFNTTCVHPDHLEPQTPWMNKTERRGYAPASGCLIPVLYPREDRLQALADAAWEGVGQPGGACPF